MVTSIDGVDSKVDKLSKRLASFHKMMDKLSGLETWRSDADKSFGPLLQRASNTSIDMGLATARLERLEARSAPPPLPLHCSRAGSEPCSKYLAAPICVERGATAQRALRAWRGGVGTLLATPPSGYVQ